MSLVDHVNELNVQCIASYKADPTNAEEWVGGERRVLAGSYGYRQILELVQNGADAVLEAVAANRDGQPGEDHRIAVRLEESTLYVANTGAPFSNDGVTSLLRANISRKRGNQIGRFGLGFKSLLSVATAMEIHSRTRGAFLLEPQRCREELARVHNRPADEMPGLRLAWPVEPRTTNSNPILTDLLQWAETVVRVELDRSRCDNQLELEIKEFPGAFLLFFDVPVRLDLSIDPNWRRTLRVEKTGGTVQLMDGKTESTWHVACREVGNFSDRAKQDATELHERRTVPVTWAYPVRGVPEQQGRLWAFFPTNTPAFVPGIVNAPWKINDDRTSVSSGDWNTELMTHAAALIVEELPKLSSADDPGRMLDAFPRTGADKEDVAKPLVDRIDDRLKQDGQLPDASGTLRPAKSYRAPPPSISEEAAECWAKLAPPTHRETEIHSSCLRGNRTARARALLANVGATATDLKAWMEAVRSSNRAGILSVLRLCEAVRKAVGAGGLSKLKSECALLPDRKGHFKTPEHFCNLPGDLRADLWEDEDVARLLASLFDIKAPKADDRRLLDLLNAARRAERDPASSSSQRQSAWSEFWTALQKEPSERRQQFVRENQNGEFRIRIRSGDWVPPWKCVVPGGIIQPTEAEQHGHLLPDDALHGGLEDSLVRLGAIRDFDPKATPSDAETAHWKDPNHSPVAKWLETRREEYRQHYRLAPSGLSEIVPAELPIPKGAWLLPLLQGPARVRLTGKLIECIGIPDRCGQVAFEHKSKRSGKMEFPSPLPVFIANHGSKAFGDKVHPLRPLVACLKRIDAGAWPEAVRGLKAVTDQLGPRADDLGTDIKDRVGAWRLLHDMLTTTDICDPRRVALWNAASKDEFVPESIPTGQGEIPISDVCVARNEQRNPLMTKLGFRVHILAEDAVKLWVNRGARDVEGDLRVGWSDESETATTARLIEVMPELAPAIKESERGKVECRSGTGLEASIGKSVKSVDCIWWGERLWIDRDRFYRQDRRKQLEQLIDWLALGGKLSSDVASAKAGLESRDSIEKRQRVRGQPELKSRLWHAVGKRPDALRGVLGELGKADFVRNLGGERLAGLILSQLGLSTLSKLKEEMKHTGLNPPERWGGDKARAFVEEIGFPPEYAASITTKRDAEEYISGPIELPDLHDFQEEVFGGIRALVEGTEARRRAVVRLPTGGGKTRVTVQAAVELVLAESGGRPRVLWIAQTDELCEQAVQSFRQVWLNLGRPNTDLRIVRYWGSHENPTDPAADEPTAVVASIQTLNSRIDAGLPRWMLEMGMFVVDECHHGIATSYSGVMRWLGIELGSPGRDASRGDVVRTGREPVMIGLSATPFRTNDEESNRLAKRFDQFWLPHGQEHLERRLRESGVLARHVLEPLESQAGINPDEERELDKGLNRDGGIHDGIATENVLEKINRRLGTDSGRNDVLMKYLLTRCKENSVLMFANSVDHSKEIAARLSLEGMAAAAVDGETPAIARRDFIKRFQQKEIRVLCNYNVLSTGFDAPKVDVVLIARQVFSPVRYMQMVGRGLRGPKNGGTETCRIVTVQDNLGRFRDRTAYHFCRQHFLEQGRGPVLTPTGSPASTPARRRGGA